MTDNENGRIICPSCQQPITPRLTFENREPQASWCPLCGAKVKNFQPDAGAALVFIVIVGIIAYYWFN